MNFEMRRLIGEDCSANPRSTNGSGSVSNDACSQHLSCRSLQACSRIVSFVSTKVRPHRAGDQIQI